MPRPELPARTLAAGALFQHVSRQRYAGTPLHFGRSGENRYDDPSCGFGVLYLAFELDTGLMETVFHAHQWHRRAQRFVTLSEVHSRLVRLVGLMQPLELADFTAPGAMAAALGLNLSQLSSRRYLHTQRASARVHAERDAAGAPRFDGLLYPSRNNQPGVCAAVFDRAAHKLAVIDDLPLDRHADWPGFVTRYAISVRPA